MYLKHDGRCVTVETSRTIINYSMMGDIIICIRACPDGIISLWSRWDRSRAGVHLPIVCMYSVCTILCGLSLPHLSRQRDDVTGDKRYRTTDAGQGQRIVQHSWPRPTPPYTPGPPRHVPRVLQRRTFPKSVPICNLTEPDLTPTEIRSPLPAAFGRINPRQWRGGGGVDATPHEFFWAAR